MDYYIHLVLFQKFSWIEMIKKHNPLILKKFHWLLLSGAAIALAVFFAVSFLVTPTYKSTATFYVYNSSNGVSTSGVINNNDLQAAESLASTYSKIFQSNAVLDSVLQDLNYKNKLSRKELSVGSQSNGYRLGTYTDEKGKEQSVWLNINEITPDSSWSQDEIDEIGKRASHNTIIQGVFQFGIIGFPFLIAWFVITIKNLISNISDKKPHFLYILLMGDEIVLPWMALDIIFFDELFLLPVYGALTVAYSSLELESGK